MPDIVQSTAKMFADDTKVYNKIRVFNDCEIMQSDLNNLSVWLRKWLLRFNESKCVVVKMRLSIQYMYTLNGHVLEQVSSQKDLGVLVSDDMKSHAHVANIVKSANRKIGMIRRCFTSMTKDKVLILYKSIIRPTLEYASTVWNPYHSKDINILENVQRRCLRLSNESIDLQTLESRRTLQS